MMSKAAKEGGVRGHASREMSAARFQRLRSSSRSYRVLPMIKLGANGASTETVFAWKCLHRRSKFD